MALTIGDKEATTGMTKAIYDELRALLEEDLKSLGEDKLAPIREGWKKIAYAVAKGVIDHITANLEVFGVTVQGNVTTAVTGNTNRSDPGNHLHAVDLSGMANNVVFTQNNDGTGRVR